MPDLSRLDWEDLRVAAALARSGTFSGAAAELGIDATTAARRIARLEAGFPFALFKAVDGRRRPTARGAEIMAHVDQMAAHAAAIRTLPATDGGAQGHIRVAATPSVCDRVLAPRAAALLVAHPGLSLTIQSSDANADFSRYEADMAVRLARPKRGGFLIRRLAAIPLAVCEPARPDEMREPIVCAYPEALADTPEMSELARLGLAERARFRSNSAGAIRAVVASGQAFAILPQFGDPPANPALRVTPIDITREAWLLIQPHLKKDPAARLVAGWIEECFRES